MFLAFRLSSTSRGNGPQLTVPEPAKPVDLELYLGLWYELGRLPNRFERGCEGVTAEYAVSSSGIIDVVNTCREGSPAGTRRISRGRAKIIAGCGNAKLKVSFFGPFYLGNYWVLDHADDYAWSIVGEPSGRFLWILAGIQPRRRRFTMSSSIAPAPGAMTWRGSGGPVSLPHNRPGYPRVCSPVRAPTRRT